MKRIRVIRGWQDLFPEDRGAVVALSSLDGVHRGHLRLIELAAEAAKDLSAPLGVVTFDPHPRAYFAPDEPTFRLMTLSQQARVLEKMAVDTLYILPFKPLAKMSDAEFANKVLFDGLGARHVVLGSDFWFGKDRIGTPASLQQHGRDLGVDVSIAPPAAAGLGGMYSSAQVREALRSGRPELAAEILGRPFTIEGAVQRGRQLGRKLGFPTANVDLADYVTPRLGVYAVRSRLPDGREYAGVANIGVNPTVEGPIRPRLEVWLFDFGGDIYDHVLATDLIAFIRPEEKLNSLEELTAKVMQDAELARSILKT